MSIPPASCESRWLKALDMAFNGCPPNSLEWHSLHEIMRALTPFMGHGLNHCMLPSGGGNEIERVSRASENQCIEFGVVAGGTYISKPRTLFFELIEESPLQSFFILELGDLTRVDREGSSLLKEELVEVAPGEYIERDAWDNLDFGYDGDGHELSRPLGARRVVRWLGGKMLFVAKDSLWSRTVETYGGQHNEMTASKIRRAITNAMRSSSSSH